MLKTLKKVLVALALLGLITSCAGPKPFQPNDNFQPINIEEKVAKKFNLNIGKLKVILEKVHKMGEPIPIYMERKGVTDQWIAEGEVPDDAHIIGYLVKEHNKIVAKIEQGNMMTDISELLLARVQIEVETYNALIEYCKLMQATAEQYRQLWINAETRVLELEHKLKWQRIENKITFLITAIGVIAILVL